MSRSRGIVLLLLLLVSCLVLRGAGAQAETEPPSGYAVNGQCTSPIAMSLPNAPALTGVTSSVPGSFFEDFEGAWPKDGWAFVDNMAYSNYWLGARACHPLEGQRSGWLHGGGSSGSTLYCGNWYPSNLETWARYGPFDLTNAASSTLTFYLFGDSEYDGDGDCTDDDFMFLMASTEPERDYRGVVYCGAWMSGDQANDYYRLSFDLAEYVGQPEVYFAFGMITDYGNNARGYHIDNLELVTTWRTPTPTPTITLTPSITPTPTQTPIAQIGFVPDAQHLDIGQDAWIDLQVCDVIYPADFYVKVAWNPVVAEILDTPNGPVQIGEVIRPNPVFVNQVLEPGRLGYAGQGENGICIGCGLFGRIHLRGISDGAFDLTYPMSYFGARDGGAMEIITHTCRVSVGTGGDDATATPTPTADQGTAHRLALPLVRSDLMPTATATLTPSPTCTMTPTPSSTATSPPTIPPTLPPAQTPSPTPTCTLTVSPTATTTPTDAVWSK